VTDQTVEESKNMTKFNQIVYTAVVVLCFASAVMCENDSGVQGTEEIDGNFME
jgi:hypothetical protein